MLTRILTAVLFLAIMGLLAARTFFTAPPAMPVCIAAASYGNPYGFGEKLRRGSTVQTGDDFLGLAIGAQDPAQASVRLWLAANTTIVLERLYEDETTVRLVRGRIVADTRADSPLRITTSGTSHLIHDDSASFVNYDFLETVHVIPLSGSVQVFVEGTGESMLTPLPLSIHETDPVVLERLEVNLEAGDAAEFYRWAGVLSDPSL